MLKSSRFLRRNFVENHGDLTLFIAANGEDYLPQKLS